MSSLTKAYEWMMKLGCINEVVVDANRVLLSEQELLLEAGDTNVKHFHDWLTLTMEMNTGKSWGREQIKEEERGFRDAFGLMLNGGNQYNPILIALANIAYNELGYNNPSRCNKDNVGIFLFKKMAPLSITDPKERQDPNSFYSRVREMVKRAWAAKSNDCLPDFNYFLNEFGDRVYDEMEETALKTQSSYYVDVDADSDYPEIIKLNTREEAYKYGQYTGTNGKGAGALCYTTGSGMWDKFSNHDNYTLYVALHKDWQNIQPPTKEEVSRKEVPGYPKDAYGLSMVWFWIDEEGGTVTNSNARWNHGFGGFDADNVFDDADLTDLLGNRFLILLGKPRILKIKQIKEHCLEHKSLDGLDNMDYTITNRFILDIPGMDNKFVSFKVRGIGYNILNLETGELLWKDRYEWLSDVIANNKKLLNEGLFTVCINSRGQNIMDTNGNLLNKDRTWYENIAHNTGCNCLCILERHDGKENLLKNDGTFLYKGNNWFDEIDLGHEKDINGPLRVRFGRLWNLINSDGELLIDTSKYRFMDLEECEYNDGFNIATTTKGEMLFVKNDGQVVGTDLPPFDIIGELKPNKYCDFRGWRVHIEGGDHNILSTDMELVWKGEDGVRLTGFHKAIFSDGCVLANQGGKTNVLNLETGHVLIGPDKDYKLFGWGTFHEHAWYIVSNGYGDNLMDSNGNLLINDGKEPWPKRITEQGNQFLWVDFGTPGLGVNLYDIKNKHFVYQGSGLIDINCSNYSENSSECLFEVCKVTEDKGTNVYNIINGNGDLMYNGDEWFTYVGKMWGYPNYYLVEYFGKENKPAVNLLKSNGEFVWKNDSQLQLKKIKNLTVLDGYYQSCANSDRAMGVLIVDEENRYNVLDLESGELVLPLGMLDSLGVNEIASLNYEEGLFLLYIGQREVNIYSKAKDGFVFDVRPNSMFVEQFSGTKTDDYYSVRIFDTSDEKTYYNILNSNGELALKEKWAQVITCVGNGLFVINFYGTDKKYLIDRNGNMKFNEPMDVNSLASLEYKYKCTFIGGKIMILDVANDIWYTLEEFARHDNETFEYLCNSCIRYSDSTLSTSSFNYNGGRLLKCSLRIGDYTLYNLQNTTDDGEVEFKFDKWGSECKFRYIDNRTFCLRRGNNEDDFDTLYTVDENGEFTKVCSCLCIEYFCLWNATDCGCFEVHSSDGHINYYLPDGTYFFPQPGVEGNKLYFFHDQHKLFMTSDGRLVNRNGEYLSNAQFRPTSRYMNTLGRYFVKSPNEHDLCIVTLKNGYTHNILLPNKTLLFGDDEPRKWITSDYVESLKGIHNNSAFVFASVDNSWNIMYPNGELFFRKDEPWPVHINIPGKIDTPLIPYKLNKGDYCFLNLDTKQRFKYVQGRRVKSVYEGPMVIKGKIYWKVSFFGFYGTWLLDENGDIWDSNPNTNGDIAFKAKSPRSERSISNNNAFDVDEPESSLEPPEEPLNEVIMKVLRKRLKYLY